MWTDGEGDVDRRRGCGQTDEDGTTVECDTVRRGTPSDAGQVCSGPAVVIAQ